MVQNFIRSVEMCVSSALVVFSWLCSPQLASAGNSKNSDETLTTKVALSPMKIVLSTVIRSRSAWEIFRSEETQLYIDSPVTHPSL